MARTPALVFVHGAGSNADFWHEQRAAFPEAHFLNLPGHTDARTRHSTGDGLHSIEGYAGWVAAHIDDAGLDNVVLNGHSMGGAITLALALQKPGWLRAIVLTSTGARLRVDPRLLELLRADYPAAVDFIIQRSFASTLEPLSYARKVKLNGTHRQMLRTPQAVTLGDYEACDRFDVIGTLGEIEVPALCIVGSHDEMTPPKYSEYLAAHIPGAELTVIEGAGHMLPLERPGEYNSRLAEFVRRL